MSSEEVISELFDLENRLKSIGHVNIKKNFNDKKEKTNLFSLLGESFFSNKIKEKSETNASLDKDLSNPNSNKINKINIYKKEDITSSIYNLNTNSSVLQYILIMIYHFFFN